MPFVTSACAPRRCTVRRADACVSAQAERPAKQPRIGYGSPLMRSGAPNKHEGPALLQSLLRAYPHEGLVTSPSPAPAAKPVPPGSFYGLNGAGGGAAAGAAMFRQSIEALKQKQVRCSARRST